MKLDTVKLAELGYVQNPDMVFFDEGDGNVCGVYMNLTAKGNMMDAAGPAYTYPNSPCCGTGVSEGWLNQCSMVSVTEAREIHPAMFQYLETGCYRIFVDDFGVATIEDDHLNSDY